MGQFIDPADLEPFATIAPAKAAAMVDDAEGMAVLTAPCLPDLLVVPDGETPADLARRTAKLSALKGILRAAILRWQEAGTGTVQTEIAGPFSKTTQYQGRRGMFWPSEIEQLQSLCASGSTGKAFAVDVHSTTGLTGHAPWCDLFFGGLDCSCGYTLTGYPIYEGGLL